MVLGGGIGSKNNRIEVFDFLKGFVDLISFFIEKNIRKLGITPSQFFVLKTIKEKEPENQKVLGEHLIHTCGNITVVLKLLERKGYIKRFRKCDDRRYLSIKLTEEGEKKLKEAEDEYSKTLENFFKDYKEEDLKHVISILSKNWDIHYKERLNLIRSSGAIKKAKAD